MSRNRACVTAVLMLLCLGLLPGGTTSAGSELKAQRGVIPVPPPAGVSTRSVVAVADSSVAPIVTLRSATGRTIRFWTQNGRTVDEVRPKARDMPHLVLRRNGALTEPEERTVILEVTGIQVPPPGVTVTLSIETQHGDPDWIGDSPPRIPVWQQSRWIANTAGITQMAATVRFQHTFDARVPSGSGSLATPTDYFGYDLQITEGREPLPRPLQRSGGDHAFLLENEWIMPLPEVAEATPGAAPEELAVYYADMFPFRRDNREPVTWLPRDQVSDYIGSELIPAMVEAYRVQTHDWGFPWYPEWTPYRADDSSERLSAALADGQIWYHGQTLGQGNAGIFLDINRGMAEYETLTDGLMSTFYHELFHNHQRNIQLHLGGSGQVGGAENAWSFFTEGMAVLASSVGQPEVQLDQTWGARQYLSNARGFLGREGISGGDLNRSYQRMSPYHAAAYWRFLYEQCGGVSDGIENPAAGMGVIRRALVALYAGHVVDIEAETDLVEHLPAIMDEALQRSSCPFRTHQESLLAFTAAIYALRLEGGRCTGPGSPGGCGFFDPDNLYHNPGVSTITYGGEEVTYSAAEQPYPAGIPSSFGADLVEVALDGAANGKPLTIEVRGVGAADAVFDVQLWKLSGGGEAARSAVPETLESTGADGQLVYAVPAIDATAYNRLGLVITRLDAGEGTDPEGAYTVVLGPVAE